MPIPPAANHTPLPDLQTEIRRCVHVKEAGGQHFTLEEAEFKAQLNDWYGTHKNYLNEVSCNEDGTQKWYTHKKLRSAYNSLKRNLPYLFTFEQNKELCMPNTTNMLEGKFGELKTKKRCHAGMNEETKRLFIENFFGVWMIKRVGKPTQMSIRS